MTRANSAFAVRWLRALFAFLGLIILLHPAALGATPDGRGGKIVGELKKWHKVTIAFEGPNAAETTDLNTFTDYRLSVTFKNGDTTYLVPGYYAADGNAAETSADSGNVWLVHFCPDQTGTWTYASSFRKGPTWP